MLAIAVSGAAGRMGTRIISLAHDNDDITVIGALEHKDHKNIGADLGELTGSPQVNIPLSCSLADCAAKIDVIIDFSTPAASLSLIREASSRKTPIVIGTTGFSPENISEIKSFSSTIPCVLAPNMSVGVNLLLKTLGDIARVLGDDYDVEVIEAHHRLKKDAPSGTALRMAQVLAEALNRDLEQTAVYSRKGLIGERAKKEIGIQTVRAGDIVGEHTVLFGGLGERIEVTHRASSRDTFARGALKAALWISQKQPGLYDMQDVLGLK